MRLRAQFRGVPEALDRLGDALDDALEGVVRDAGARAAFAAKARHPYTDRTHTLTDSIEGSEPRGRFMAGTLEGAVVAGADYAEYVDRRPSFRFLQPAWDAVEHHVEQLADDALESAARAAGW